MSAAARAPALLPRALAEIGGEVRDGWRSLLLWGLAAAVFSQVFMLAMLMLRFGAAPNYVEFYDWFGAVAKIIRSTPSASDWAPIIWEEWLIEIGRMNYDYGAGISEWSLNVVPSRLLMLFGLGVLTALCLRLARARSCGRGAAAGGAAATGLGAALVAITNATMSWVVCCATPSWVVGLAMMGLGVSTSLALERIGPWVSLSGYALLFAAIFALAARRAARAAGGGARPAPSAPTAMEAHHA